MSAPRTTPDGDRCARGAELTAFALGEGSSERREALARHLLACARCRREADADAALVGRLRRFADLRPWEEDMAAADLADAARGRRRRRAALAGGLVAAAMLAAASLAPSGLGPAREPSAPRATASADTGTPSPSSSPSAVASLLSAQAPDGRWRAAGAGERHDVGATGLAILALLRGNDVSLEQGEVGRAVAHGVRWLAPRIQDERAASTRDRAVAAAALAEVYARTRERTLRTLVDRARSPRETAAVERWAGSIDPSRALGFIRTE